MESPNGGALIAGDQATGGGSHAPLRSYPARYHMLTLFALLGLVNQMMYLTFASIPERTARRFEVHDGLVTAMAIECVVLYLPGAFMTARVLASFDLRRVVLVGCTLQVVGAVIRYAADLFVRKLSPHAAYAFVFVGQGITGLAAPSFMNTPAVLAETWFNEKQRDTAVAIATVSALLGQGAGSAVSGLVITGHSGEGTNELLGVSAAVAILMGVWVACAFRAAPPSPPSMAAEDTGGTRNFSESAPPSTFTVWRQCLRRPQFLLLMSIFIGGLGLATILLTLFAKIIGKCGYDSATAGIASLLFMVGGVFGSLASGAAMGATHAYRCILRVSTSLAVSSGFMFMACLQPGQLIVLYVLVTLFGLCMLSVLPVLIANGVEETYPLPPDVSTSLLFVAAIIVQIFLTPLGQLIIDSEGDTCGGLLSPFRVFVYSIGIFSCLIPALLYNGQYYRLQAEAGAKERQ